MKDWKFTWTSKPPKYLWLWITVVGFIGYAVGRIGSILWGYLNLPHHWIYGLVIILISFYYKKQDRWWWVILLSFGLGLFISDLNDAVNLQFWGVDTVEVQKFWGID